ncbi:MAG TPA: hypothetical protein DIC60_03235 [Lachnospiraceae bacterium]|nr:hypothetical protein [Lachnospiraceae bacterium]
MKHEWLKEILGEGYTEEVDKKVAEKIGELFVSRADFNEVNETKKNLDAQIKSKDKDNGDLNKTSGGNEELQRKYDELQEKYTSETEVLNKKISDSQKESAIDLAIFKAKGKNPKAIKALLDMEKITLKADGSLEGLDLESLKKSDGYLFDIETKKGVGTGFTKGTTEGTGKDVNAQIAKAMGIKTN